MAQSVRGASPTSALHAFGEVVIAWKSIAWDDISFGSDLCRLGLGGKDIGIVDGVIVVR